MGGPLLWGAPPFSTNLQNGIQLTSTGSSVQTGAVNPTSTATLGLPGSLYLNNSTGLVYIKQDSGTTTNWLAASLGTPVLASYSLSTNQSVSGGAIIKFNTLVSDASSLYSPSTGMFTFPTAGLYLFGIVTVSSGTSNVLLYKNGGTTQTYISTTSGAFGSGSLVAVVAAGDTFEFVSESSVTYSGGAAPITCSMFAVLLSGSSGGGGGSGTVTSVAQTVPSDLTVSGSPITTSGTLAITRNSQTQNLFMASPNGSSGVPTYRAVVAADIPTLNQNTTGTAASVTGTNVITNTNLAQMPTNTIKGNNTGGTANALDLTVAQVNTLLGSTPATDVQSFSSSGTWTKPSGTPKSITIYLQGSGGGGGSGRKGPTGTIQTGGGGGASGQLVQLTVLPALFGGTEAVTVGTGGSGGTAVTTTGTSGNVGGVGGFSSINNFKALGGSGGAGGASAASAAGGTAVGSTSLISMISIAGAASGATGGGTSASVTSFPIATSGGSGGGLNAAPLSFGGGNGGAYVNTGNLVNANPGGAGGAAAGSAGSPGPTYTFIGGLPTGTGGGGGGGSGTASVNGGVGGAGGSGGGGGGGGAASLDTAGNSGAGGAGGNGWVVVVTEF